MTTTPPSSRRSNATGYLADGLRPAAAVGLLVVLLASVVMAAAADHSSGQSTFRPGPASELLTIGVTLLGLLAIVMSAITLAALLGRNRIAASAFERNRKSPYRILAFAAFVLLGCFIRMLVGLAHPKPSTGRPGGPSGKLRTPGKSSVHFQVATSAFTVGAVVLIALVLLALAWWRARGRRHRVDPLHFEPLNDSVFEAGATSFADAVASVRVPDPSEEPDPRRAVVAAYLAMVAAAGEFGLERSPAETPGEFLERLFGSLGVTAGAAARLTRLFEQARYSSAPVTETLRTDAISALAAVKTELATALAGASS